MEPLALQRSPTVRYVVSWSSGIDYLASCEGGIAGLRVAWSPDLGYATLDSAVQEATERAAQRFADLGCDVEEDGERRAREELLHVAKP